MTAKKPVHELRLGRITCAIWENETTNGIRHNVTFKRIYKAEDQWKSTDSFGRDDLPLIAKLADQAHSWIHAQS
ncbi:MAG: hypothetical protein MPJ50_19340 [Pirellulales bacterium]|nr:hypothetical protein [Pirellulales bacterium]